MKTQYKIRVNYKSGIQEEFWCKEFHIKNDVYSKKVEEFISELRKIHPYMISISEIPIFSESIRDYLKEKKIGSTVSNIVLKTIESRFEERLWLE